MKREPLVYCLEQQDIEGGIDIDNILIPTDAKFTPVDIVIAGSRMKALDLTAKYVPEQSAKSSLYHEINTELRDVNISLIPHYAYGNRGLQDITIFMPLCRK